MPENAREEPPEPDPSDSEEQSEHQDDRDAPAPGGDPEYPSEATNPEEDGRTRLAEALRTPRRTQVVVALVLLLVGFAAVIQVRTTVDDASYQGLREQDLIDIFSGLAGTSERAQSQLQELQATKAELEDDSSQRQAAIDQARSQVEALKILAGRVPVSGPGIVVTVTEYTTVDLVDFLNMIEELRTNGAEAIEVNDVRLVASSYITATADGFVIDGQEITSPYVVRAVGPPAALEGGMTFYDGPVDSMTEDEAAQVDIREGTPVEIRSVTE